MDSDSFVYDSFGDDFDYFNFNLYTNTQAAFDLGDDAHPHNHHLVQILPSNDNRLPSKPSRQTVHHQTHPLTPLQSGRIPSTQSDVQMSPLVMPSAGMSMEDDLVSPPRFLAFPFTN